MIGRTSYKPTHSVANPSRENRHLNDFDIFAPKISAILLSCHGNIITIVKLSMLFLEFG